MIFRFIERSFDFYLMGTISDCNFAILNHNLSPNVKGFRDEYLSAGGIMGKLEKFSMRAL
jgi:hypothetical protein